MTLWELAREWVLATVIFVAIVVGAFAALLLFTPSDEDVIKRLTAFSPAHCWTLCVGANEIHHTAGYFVDPANDSYGDCPELYKVGFDKAAGTLFKCARFYEACACVDEAAK